MQEDDRSYEQRFDDTAAVIGRDVLNSVSTSLKQMLIGAAIAFSVLVGGLMLLI